MTRTRSVPGASIQIFDAESKNYSIFAGKPNRDLGIMLKPIPFQRVLEIRYERGYRYLDRCGEAMLILQDVLPEETGHVWMPEDMIPSGAKIKCPDLDLRVSFDATRLIVEHSSNEEMSTFAAVTSAIFSIIAARFDLRTIVRLGSRRFLIIGTDSAEEADILSSRLFPVQDWPTGREDGLLPKSGQASATYESEDGSFGFNFSFKSVAKIEAHEPLDERAKFPPRLLESGQQKALIDQMKRRSIREKKPNAGVIIDLDYYEVRPTKPEIQDFYLRSNQAGDKIIESFLKGR